MNKGKVRFYILQLTFSFIIPFIHLISDPRISRQKGQCINNYNYKNHSKNDKTNSVKCYHEKYNLNYIYFSILNVVRYGIFIWYIKMFVFM